MPFRLLFDLSINKVHVMLCYVLYHTIKVLKALQETKNRQRLKIMQCGIQDGSFCNFVLRFQYNMIQSTCKVYVEMETRATLTVLWRNAIIR